MLRIIALEQFRREFKDFPDSTKEDFSSLIEQFISGERFQALADISFIHTGNGNGESECGFVKEQQNNNKYIQ